MVFFGWGRGATAPLAPLLATAMYITHCICCRTNHFKDCGAPILGTQTYPTPEKQKQRFKKQVRESGYDIQYLQILEVHAHTYTHIHDITLTYIRTHGYTPTHAYIFGWMDGCNKITTHLTNHMGSHYGLVEVGPISTSKEVLISTYRKSFLHLQLGGP